MAVAEVYEDGRTLQSVSIRREDCDEDANHEEILEALEGECSSLKLVPCDLTDQGTPNLYLRGCYDAETDEWEGDIYMLFAEKRYA